MEEDEEIIIIENKLKECEADFYKLLKPALVELKLINETTYINRNIICPIVEKPTFRIKSAKSIRDKIISKGYNFNNFITNMNDLLGIRVICLNLSSLDHVYKKLQDSKDIQFLKDMEKYQIKTPAEDGYRGIHLYFTAENGILHNSKLKGEIQLRTIAQHYWATFSHPDVYKAHPTLSCSEATRIKDLSEYLYLIDKQVDSLRLDIKSDPNSINVKTLHSLFQQIRKPISNEDTEILFNTLSGAYEIVNGNLESDIFGNENIFCIYKALNSQKNTMGRDLSEIREWTNVLYNFVFQRDATEGELIFCQLYSYFKGFYWPKRRLFEYVLSLKTKDWNDLLGSNLPKPLATLLEASIYENIEKYSYYHSKFESRDRYSFGSKYNDSTLLSNRGVEELSKVGLLTVRLDENVKTYPDLRPDLGDFSYKKDTYYIKCTSEGKSISLKIIEKLFHNNSTLKSILDDLEIEDFPQPDFPYKKPSDWGFFDYNCVIDQSNRKGIGKSLNFSKKDWWTEKPGYY